MFLPLENLNYSFPILTFGFKCSINFYSVNYVIPSPNLSFSIISVVILKIENLSPAELGPTIKVQCSI